MVTSSTMNSNTLNVGNDAPPPYSETDIYSTTSHSHSRSPHSPHPPTSHLSPNDDAASRVSSSTATGDVIFTPPETPRTTTATNAPPEIPPSPSVALYLDSRPAPPVSQAEGPVVHTVAVKATSSPDDLPYQSQWAARDVTVQDWATFVNFLMPDHDATRNEAILGEKGATEGSVSEGSEKRVPEQPEDPALRRRQAEAMVQQWNDGFFGPRGIRVQLSPEEEQPRMPGAWDNTFDEGQTPQAGPSVPREAGPSTQRAGRGNMNWGGFTIGNDSIRYGDSFVADSNGLRIGSLVMDNNGIRMDHRRQMPLAPIPRGCPPFGGHHHHHHHGPPFGGPPGHQPPWAAPHEADDRGRPAHHDPKGPRSRDSSTSSSSSSDSSDSSDSIGSLPDYDDVKDQQLPLYISRLESWTGNPQQMRTKAEVKQLKAEIKASKSNRLPDDVDKAALRAQIKTLTRQWQQLKKQQKRTRREHKRERKQRRRAEKRERRQQRRDMKRAQKDHRKGRNVPPRCGPGPQIHVPPINVPPINVPPINVSMGGPPGHAPQVQVPPVPVPPVHVPPVPAPPPPFSGPSCGWGGGGRGGRGCGPRDRSFFGPNGPFGRNGAFGGDNGPLGPHGFFGSGGPFGPRGSVGGFGRGRGRGWGGGGPFGPGPYHHSDPGFGGGPGPDGHASNDRYPGSWPDERGGADAPQTGVTESTPAPGPASAEKYRVVADLETEIVNKTESLSSVPGGEKKAAEKEIEALLEKLEHLRLEADETYARELAAKDGQ